MPSLIDIRILESSSSAALVAMLREKTHLPLAQIAAAIKSQSTIRLCELFGRDHTSSEAIVHGVLSSLDGANVPFELLVDGRVEKFEYLKNRIESFHQMALEVQLETELEIGEPSPEAERWGRGEFVERPK